MITKIKRGPEGPSEIVPQPLGQSHSLHPTNTTQETKDILYVCERERLRINQEEGKKIGPFCV